MELFNFDNNEVRVVYLGDTKEPWWVAKDICRALGMDTLGGTTQWLKELRLKEKQRVSKSTLRNSPGAQGLFQRAPGSVKGVPGWLTIINESGLYKLIMRSRKPDARRFQDWLTCEVLPALRRDGYYVTEEVRREHPEAVRQFEQSILSKADPEEVSTSLAKFLRWHGIDLGDTATYWMAMGQLMERSEHEFAAKNFQRKRDTALFKVSTLEEWLRDPKVRGTIPELVGST